MKTFLRTGAILTASLVISLSAALPSAAEETPSPQAEKLGYNSPESCRPRSIDGKIVVPRPGDCAHFGFAGQGRTHAHAKNVILLIGDGMGQQEITAARDYLKGAGGRFEGIDELPATGSYTHHSINKDGTFNYVTDSAASATGLLTGTKTYKGGLGVDLAQEPVQTVLEYAKNAGMRTGNITTADIQDATPAALVAHSASRECAGPDMGKNAEECRSEEAQAKQMREHGGLGSISEQIVQTRADITLGGGADRFEDLVQAGGEGQNPFLTSTKKVQWKAGKSVRDNALANGYQILSTAEELEAVTEANQEHPVLGLFSQGSMDTRFEATQAAPGGALAQPQTCQTRKAPKQPELKNMTKKAIELLDNKESDKGFFLQVESARIDTQDHAADACGMIGEVARLDEAVQEALNFAKKDKETLVIVTADHAQAAQVLPDNSQSVSSVTRLKGADGVGVDVGYGTVTTEKENPLADASADTTPGKGTPGTPANVSHQHTGSQVRIAAYGPGAENVIGQTDQTDTFFTMTNVLGLGGWNHNNPSDRQDSQPQGVDKGSAKRATKSPTEKPTKSPTESSTKSPTEKPGKQSKEQTLEAEAPVGKPQGTEDPEKLHKKLLNPPVAQNPTEKCYLVQQGSAPQAGDCAQFGAEGQKYSKEKAKNVVLVISDGTGDSEITSARNYLYGANGRFRGADTFDYTGFVTTYSLDQDTWLPDMVTDSAASGTAWNTGVKTYNGAIGVDVSGVPVPTLGELAKKKGMKIGNVTTAEIQDATPAAFATHSLNRKCYGPQEKENDESCQGDQTAKQYREKGGLGSISEQLVDLRADVTLGGGAQVFDQKVVQGGHWAGHTWTAGTSVLDNARSQGFQIVTSSEELQQVASADSDKPLLGLFSPGNFPRNYAQSIPQKNGAALDPQQCTANPERPNSVPPLPVMTKKALDLLRNEKGFVLQVEAASVDKAGHDADACGQFGEFKEYDDALQTVKQWVEETGEPTLIISTADHAHTSQITEPGKLTSGRSTTVETREGAPMTLNYATARTNADEDALGGQTHTGAQIRVAASGPGAENVLGQLDQTDIHFVAANAADLRSAASHIDLSPQWDAPDQYNPTATGFFRNSASLWYSLLGVLLVAVVGTFAWRRSRKTPQAAPAAPSQVAENTTDK